MNHVMNAQQYPAVPSLRGYKARYYSIALRTILCQHRLDVDRDFSTYKSGFCLSEAEQDAWFRLFDISMTEGRYMPFSYLTTSATVLFMELIAELGINFKYLRHVKSVQTFEPEHYAVRPNAAYQYILYMDDIIAPGDDRIVIVVKVAIRDEFGRQCGTNEEYFMVTGLTPEQTAPLKAQTRFGHHAPAEFCHLRERAPQIIGDEGDYEAITFTVPDNMGADYGAVSGDMNLVHTTVLAARLFGHSKPFIQGFCTTNYLVKWLTRASNRSLRGLSTTLIRPLYVGDDVQIRMQDKQYEVFNATGKLAAYGSWE